jgi:hypothetical protein
MGTYADSLLTDGEVVLRRARQHWLSLLIEGRIPLILLIIGLLALLAVAQFDIQGSGRTLISVVALVAIVIGIGWLSLTWWHWRTDEYVITNRRLLKVEGIINKKSGDSNLEKINDAVLRVNLVGRLLDYGDLDILTAADVAVDRYRMLNHAKAFKKDMMTAKHALEEGRSYTDLATPPIRATPAPPPPATDTFSTPRADSPDEVAQSLARLVTLRDTGAITPEDYETKKQELLRRL